MAVLFLFLLFQLTWSFGSLTLDVPEWKYWWTRDGREQWQDTFRRHNITSDMCEEVIPRTFLGIRFGSKYLNAGDFISPLDTGLPPNVSWYCRKDRYYTLILLTVDAPGGNKGNQYLMWKVEGISNCQFSSGLTTAVYTPAIPTLATGSRRYLALLFESINKNPPSGLGAVVRGSAGRVDFNGCEFIKEMEGEGKLWAGNFFLEKAVILGNVNLAPGISELPLSGATNPLSKIENSLK